MGKIKSISNMQLKYCEFQTKRIKGTSDLRKVYLIDSISFNYRRLTCIKELSETKLDNQETNGQ